ncbi:MAG: hypothetical protein HY319_29710 [Armatimonadetes bacterium]|nr:hypothetical protein [Armatimonadota bacterium]
MRYFTDAAYQELQSETQQSDPSTLHPAPEIRTCADLARLLYLSTQRNGPEDSLTTP